MYIIAGDCIKILQYKKNMNSQPLTYVNDQQNYCWSRVEKHEILTLIN